MASEGSTVGRLHVHTSLGCCMGTRVVHTELTVLKSCWFRNDLGYRGVDRRVSISNVRVLHTQGPLRRWECPLPSPTDTSGTPDLPATTASAAIPIVALVEDFFVAPKPLNGSAHTEAADGRDLAGVSAYLAARQWPSLASSPLAATLPYPTVPLIARRTGSHSSRSHTQSFNLSCVQGNRAAPPPP